MWKEVMKIYKLFITTILFTFVLFLLTGCSNNSDNKANCSSLECIIKLKVDNTVEEVNKITGVKGVLYDKENKFYRYDLDNGETITFKNGVLLDYRDLNSLKKKVSSGITYDMFKEEIGGVDGTLIEKSESSNKYFWASKDGGYITAIFRNKDNKCFYFYGYGDVR